ncbi:hypothetical protein SynPROS71_01505 [Synechococcus sp. PROS-7-1]|nr:hypothetical protein SynPROS71_01505 [Synechococcus sp. PROS-7-1]
MAKSDETPAVTSIKRSHWCRPIHVLSVLPRFKEEEAT